MKIFLTLFQKEWLEAWRDKKLLWLPIVMILTAVSQPIALYYMADVLEGAGNLPEGSVIEIPLPSGEEVLASTLSQFDIIGTAIVVLSVMGIISHERSSGALALVMARPVAALHYIASKWLAYAFILIFSFTVSYGFAYYYTIHLFQGVSLGRFFASSAIYCLWILFVMAVTLTVGTMIKKTGGIAGVSLLLAAGLSLLSSLFPEYMKWSPANASREANHFLLTGEWGDAFYPAVIASSFLIMGLFMLAILLFKRFESFAA